MQQWGQGEYLPNNHAVLRLDMKQVDYNKSLFDNVLIQYQVLLGKYSDAELKAIEEALRTHQERLVWMLDGIDESQSHFEAERFITNSQQRFSKSTFIML